MDGFLTALQLFPDRARPAPDEVRVVIGVVADYVLGGDLGGQVGSRLTLFPIWKNVALTPGLGPREVVRCTGGTARRRRSGRPLSGVRACQKTRP